MLRTTFKLPLTVPCAMQQSRLREQGDRVWRGRRHAWRFLHRTLRYEEPLPFFLQKIGRLSVIMEPANDQFAASGVYSKAIFSCGFISKKDFIDGD